MALPGVKLSIVVPTCGRETLRDTIQSVLEQGSLADELIVIGDGEQRPWVRHLVEGVGGRYLEHGPTRDWGNQQRNLAYTIAHGDYVCHMDDDDVFAPEAFIKIRKAAAQRPGSPLMFRMVTVPGEIVWSEKTIERGNTGTPMLVLPNVRELLTSVKWPRRQGGDITYFQDIVRVFEQEKKPLVWREEIICQCRPQVRWWA